jgi:hypothetical protein
MVCGSSAIVFTACRLFSVVVRGNDLDQEAVTDVDDDRNDSLG